MPLRHAITPMLYAAAAFATPTVTPQRRYMLPLMIRRYHN